MPEYVDVEGVSSDGKSFIEYALASGFDFFEIVEEPKYAEYLKSYPSNKTARYHFIEMITEGGHGIDRPMLNAEIVKAHPEITSSQVQELRELYESTKNRRPFKVALESKVAPILPVLITGARTFADDFERYFKTTNPLKIRIDRNPIGVSQDAVVRSLKRFGRSDTKFVGSIVPPVANPGDLWLNTLSGSVYFYITDGSTGGTSGAGMTSAWVEI
jgi:hypothetical protein